MSQDSRTSCAEIGSSRRIARAATRWRACTAAEPCINAGRKCSARWHLARERADFSLSSWRFPMAERIWRWSACGTWDDSSRSAMAAPVRWCSKLSALPADHVSTDWLLVTAVLCLGTWISLLVHRPSFLQWNVSLLRVCGRYARKWFIDFPVSVVRSKFVQYILASYAFRVLQDYALPTDPRDRFPGPACPRSRFPVESPRRGWN